MLYKSLRHVVEKYPMVADFYRNSRDFFDQRMQPLQTPWGFSLIGHEEMAKGNFEPLETQLVREKLNEVDILINVGANIGYYCCHALSLGKQVIAIEPLERNIRYLLKNMINNGWQDQVEIFPVALSNQTDILELCGGSTGASLIKGWAGASENYVRAVPVLTLDRIVGDTLKEKKALIIVDIEGAELSMLQGAMNLLNQAIRPIWLVEICFDEHQPFGKTTNPNFTATFEIFFSKKYKARAVCDDAYQITPEIVDLITLNKFNLTTHNFLFE